MREPSEAQEMREPVEAQETRVHGLEVQGTRVRELPEFELDRCLTRIWRSTGDVCVCVCAWL